MQRMPFSILIVFAALFILIACDQKNIENPGKRADEKSLPTTFENEDLVVVEVTA